VNPDFKNIRHVSALWIAATNGYFRAVHILLDTRLVNVNSQSISSRPPLFWATAHGYQNIIELLIQFRADPTLVDVDGNTPLSIAKQQGYYQIAKILASR
ncbi:ankyrin repeat-containing domain protein, partial [Amylocarpus encephaloides]